MRVFNTPHHREAGVGQRTLLPLALAIIYLLLSPDSIAAQANSGDRPADGTIAQAHATLDWVDNHQNTYTDSVVHVLQESAAVLSKAPKAERGRLVEAYVHILRVAGQMRDERTGINAYHLALPLLATDLGTRARAQKLYMDATGGMTALTYFKEAEPLAKKAVEYADDPRIKFDALNRYAYCFLGQGDGESAFEVIDQALALREWLTPDAIAKVHANRGVLHYQMGNCAAAMADYTAAIATYSKERSKNRPMMMRSICHDEAGDYELALADMEGALRYLADTATAGQPINELTFDDLESANLEMLLLSQLSERSRFLLRLGRDDEVIASFNHQYALLKKMRESMPSRESRRGISSFDRWAFDRMVSFPLHANEARPQDKLPWEALWATDLARAYSYQLGSQADDEEISERELQLEEKLAERERLPDSEAKTSDLRLELDYLRRHQTRPSLREWTAAELRVNTARYLVDNELQALVFHVSDTVAYALHLVPNQTPDYWRLPVADSLEQLTENFRKALRQSAYAKKSLLPAGEQERLDMDFLRAGRTLADAVLPPKLSRENLVILPDGPLHFLPFAALPLEGATAPIDYSSLTYLGSDHELQYAYSLRTLMDPPIGKEEAEVNLAAFAPAFKGGVPADGLIASLRAVAGDPDQESLQLPSLAFNGREVEAIATDFLSPRIFLAEEANRSNFLSFAPRARIIHLSTHGMVNNQNANLSFLAFSQPAGGVNNQELLYFNDLRIVPLRADLAVLSACETSLGQLAPGELPRTLATAFASAGAKSTLTTLWQVDDEATSLLMQSFYRQLGAGKSRSAALQTAQAELVEAGDYAHPYYWSGLTLHGEAGLLSLEPENKSWWKWGLSALLLAGALAFFFRRNRGAAAGAV